MEALERHVENWDFVALTRELEREGSEDFVSANTWDLVGLLTGLATMGNLEKCPQLVNTASILLANRVIELCPSPKEAVVALLEQCEESKVKFRHCLPALKIALVNVDEKASKLTWDWALSCVLDQVSNYMPDLPELEVDERLMLKEQEDYSECVGIIHDVLDLLEALKTRLESFKRNDDHVGPSKSAQHVIDAGLQLLAKPLCCLVEGDEELRLAKQLVDNVINVLVANPMTLRSENCSFGCYLRLCRESRLPAVYSAVFIFDSSLPSIVKMLGENYLVQEKGIDLAGDLLSKIEKDSFSAGILDMPEHSAFIERLQHIIIYHNVKSTRTMGFRVYEVYCSKFTPRGFRQMAIFVIEKANHSGLIGHAIGQLKDKVLTHGHKEDCYRGKELEQLVRRFCRLAKGAETDLLEVSEEIMASLNFLIAIGLRDNANNNLGFCDFKADIVESFLKPLETGLKLSKAHFQLRLETNSTEGESVADQVTLTVGGQPLPHMTKSQMRDVTTSAINTFDMMSCVLAQLNAILSK